MLKVCNFLAWKNFWQAWKSKRYQDFDSYWVHLQPEGPSVKHYLLGSGTLVQGQRGQNRKKDFRISYLLKNTQKIVLQF